MEDLSAIHCEICRSGLNENKLLLCDKCDKGYHTYCLKPRLNSLPEGNWFCHNCTSSVKNNTAQSDANRSSDAATNKNEDIKLHIQCLIACQEMTKDQWEKYLVKPGHSTMNIQHGSLWCENDDVSERVDRMKSSAVLKSSAISSSSSSTSTTSTVTKQRRYLVKWANYSYLHLSWETEEDLLRQLGSIATTFIDKFIVAMNALPPLSNSWYPNLRFVEFVSPEFRCIDKIVDFLQGDDSVEGHYKVSPVPGLHGTNCSVAIKWRGYGYSLVTYEEIADLQNQGIQYQSALRAFLYNESLDRGAMIASPEYGTQLARYLGENVIPRSTDGLTGLGFKSLVRTYLESEDLLNHHQFYGGQQLKPHQWEGLKWLLRCFADDGRGALLADSARSGKKVQIFAFLDVLMSLRTRYIHGSDPSAPIIVDATTFPASSSTPRRNEVIDLCDETDSTHSASVSHSHSSPLIHSTEELSSQNLNPPSSLSVKWSHALRGSFLFITASSAPQKLESLSAQLLLWSGMHSVRYYGSTEEKRILVDAEFKYLLDSTKPGFKPQCVIVSHEDFTKDFTLFQSVEWSVVAFDKYVDNEFVITSSGTVKSKPHGRCSLKSLSTYLKSLEKVFMFVLLDAELSPDLPKSEAYLENLFIALNFLDPTTYSDRDHLETLLAYNTTNTTQCIIPSLLGRNRNKCSIQENIFCSSNIVTSSSSSNAIVTSDSITSATAASDSFKFRVVTVEPSVNQFESDLQLLLIQAPWMIRLREKVSIDVEVFEYDHRFGPGKSKRAPVDSRPISAEHSDALYMTARQLRQQSSVSRQSAKLLIDVAQRMIGSAEQKKPIDNIAKKSLLSLIQREYPKIAKIMEIVQSNPSASIVVILQFRLTIDVLEAVFRAMDVTFSTMDFNAAIDSLLAPVSNFIAGDSQVLIMSTTSPTEVFQGFEGDVAFNIGPVFARASHVVLFDGVFDTRLTIEEQLMDALQRHRDSHVVEPTPCECIRLVTKGSFEDHLHQSSSVAVHLFDPTSSKWTGFPATLSTLEKDSEESLKAQLVLAQAENSLWPVFANDVEMLLKQYILSAPLCRARDGQLGTSSQPPPAITSPDFWFEYFAPFKSKIEIIVSRQRQISSSVVKRGQNGREFFYHALVATTTSETPQPATLFDNNRVKSPVKRSQSAMSRTGLNSGDSQSCGSAKRLRTMMVDTTDLESRHSTRSMTSTVVAAARPMAIASVPLPVQAVVSVAASAATAHSMYREPRKLIAGRDLVFISDPSILQQYSETTASSTDQPSNGVMRNHQDATSNGHDSDEDDLHSMADVPDVFNGDSSSGSDAAASADTDAQSDSRDAAQNDTQNDSEGDSQSNHSSGHSSDDSSDDDAKEHGGVKWDPRKLQNTMIQMVLRCGVPRLLYSALPPQHPAHFSMQNILNELTEKGVMRGDETVFLAHRFIGQMLADLPIDISAEEALLLELPKCDLEFGFDFQTDYNDITEQLLLKAIPRIDSIRLFLCLDAETQINFVDLVVMPGAAADVFANGKLKDSVVEYCKESLSTGRSPKVYSFIAKSFFYNLCKSAHLVVPFISKCAFHSRPPTLPAAVLTQQKGKRKGRRLEEQVEPSAAHFLAHYILHSKFPI